MKKILISGIGNALVDSAYKVSEEEITELNLTKGCMELNDKENHVKLSLHLKKTHGAVNMMPGGSVANSLYTLSQFGSDVSFIGRVSDDTAGDAFIKSLEIQKTHIIIIYYISIKTAFQSLNLLLKK